MKTVLLGIDPGVSGGIAVRSTDGRVVAHAMPPTMGDTVDLLIEEVRAAHAEGHIVSATMELVGGYAGGAGQPGSAMFKFGRGFGAIESACYALGIRLNLVRPQDWQKALGLGTSKSHASKTAWKNHLKTRAQQLYPAQRVNLKVADALLILEFATKNSLND